MSFLDAFECLFELRALLLLYRARQTAVAADSEKCHFTGNWCSTCVSTPASSCCCVRARPGRARGESVWEVVVDDTGAMFPVLYEKAGKVAEAGLSGARFGL